jgi:uncharacterized damage-inducible protein DinB
MQTVIHDLLGHQAWADAELWHAIELHEPARTDRSLHDRLHHLHLVQQAFTWIVGDRSEEFRRSRPEDYPAFGDLKAFAREAHAGVDRLLSRLTDARLATRVTIDWFKEPPLTLTVSEALAQCAMHSQWHRGQNATRLRELGGTPPTIDLILWFWKDRPAPDWR